MTHLDNLVADSLAQSPDTVVHQLASEVVRLRGELEAARAEIADLKRGGVVVPEPSIDDDEAILKSLPAGYEFDDGPIPLIHAAVAWARERSRAIPADRELMRLVDELIRWHGLRPLDKRPDHAAALVGAIKALRAQPTQEPTT